MPTGTCSGLHCPGCGGHGGGAAGGGAAILAVIVLAVIVAAHRAIGQAATDALRVLEIAGIVAGGLAVTAGGTVLAVVIARRRGRVRAARPVQLTAIVRPGVPGRQEAAELPRAAGRAVGQGRERRAIQGRSGLPGLAELDQAIADTRRPPR